MDWGYGGWGKSSSLSFLFRCSHSFVTRFFLGLVLYSILFPYFYCFCFFLAEKTMFSLKTLLKGTFSLLTCHLQFSITARVSMTLKRQSVQSLSGHKAAHTFCVSQEGGIVEVMVWSKTKWSFPLVWSSDGGGGERWVRLGRESKNKSKNTIENDKEKIKERKRERKKSFAV